MKYINLFWKPINENLPIKHCSTPHTFSLIIIAIIIILIYIFRNTLKKRKYEKFFSNFLGIILIIHQISIYTWYITNKRLTLKECLPLYPCRISVILCIIMIFTKSKKIFDVIYFWGLGGASAALLFHDNFLFPFPHYIFIQFFVSHGGILICVFFMMFVHNYFPNIHSLYKTFKWTFIYFSFTIPINYIIDSNYCYLRYKPDCTLLDFLPNDPIFIVPLIILNFYLVFVLLYIPFRKKKLF